MTISSGGAKKVDASSAHKKHLTLTREHFDGLLAWLHPNREQAATIYEEIRSRLIKGFRSHGCMVPEELVDETINRVARKLHEFVATYTGDPARYFFRVAHYVHLEYLRAQPEFTQLPDDMPLRESADDVEAVYECLEKCMQHLTPRNRELVSQYYQGEKNIKIELRKELARRLGIKLPILRLQAHRIRINLKNCIQNCMQQRAA